MLFDLQSPGRRRVVRITFGALAAVFAISFVLLGVGTGGGGFSISDLFGGSSGSSGAGAFESDIKAAEQRLAANPNDDAALAQLVTLHYQAGTQEVQVDQSSGQQSLTSEGKQQFEQSVDAWAKYFKLTGDKAARAPAAIAYQAYSVLYGVDLSGAVAATTGAEQLSGVQAAVADLKGAAEAQAVVAVAQPNLQNWGKVADAYYRAGDSKEAEDAIAEAAKTNPKGAANLKQQLKSSQEFGAKLTQAITQLTKQQQQVQSGGGGAPGGGNPLSGLGTGGAAGGGF